MEQVILGVDPGLAHCGWGVISIGSSNTSAHFTAGNMKLIDCGEICSKADVAFSLRLKKIYDAIDAVLEMYHPRVCCVEDLYMNKNTSSALPVAHARGVILLCATQRELPVYSYSANSIKQSVTGHGKASKLQVQQMVSFLLGTTHSMIQKSDHAADALAAAICQALQQSHSILGV